ncbi:LptA/OstA family protein, partial [Oleiphilus sp. HI0061]
MSASVWANDNSSLTTEACSSAKSASPSTELTSEKPVKPEEGIVIHAKEVNYLPDENLELKGDIEFTHGPYHAQSNEASINKISQTAELKGDIVLSSPDLILKGDSATVNMTSDRVSVINASFSNPKTSINGKASEITRADENTLLIHDGLFTSCPPEKRDWAFAAENISLNREEGFGQ